MLKENGAELRAAQIPIQYLSEKTMRLEKADAAIVAQDLQPISSALRTAISINGHLLKEKGPWHEPPAPKHIEPLA